MSPSLYFNSPFSSDMYTLSLHDALPISTFRFGSFASNSAQPQPSPHRSFFGNRPFASLIITNQILTSVDRNGTRLNSSHLGTSYTAFIMNEKSANLPARRYAGTSSAHA